MNAADTDGVKGNNVEKILKNLKFFHQMKVVPDSIKPLLKDNQMELGS
jgi:hypothetical protein